MKKMKKVVCSIALASLLITTIVPINVFATETDNDNTTVTTEVTNSDENGGTTTTTTTTTTTNEDGSTNINVDKVVETHSSTIEMPLKVSAPARIPDAVDGNYVIDLEVTHTYDLEGLRFIKGKTDFSSWEEASPCTTTVTIPVPESDSFYTVLAKDVKGNLAYANLYVHCEKKDPTPTECPENTYKDENGVCVEIKNKTPEEIVVTVAPITVTPIPETQGCPDGYKMDENGNCYTENPGCPEGYQEDANGICVQTPIVTTNNSCPEGQYMDENGNCIDKVQTLPQTGGFDSLMMIFVFGIGLTVCGVSVYAYANKKEKDQNKNDKE